MRFLTITILFNLTLISNLYSFEGKAKLLENTFIEEQARVALDKELKEVVNSFIKLPNLIDLGNSMDDCDDLVNPDGPSKKQDFIMVGIAGFGTKRNGEGQPSGAHDNLPVNSSITSTYEMTHKMSKNEMAQVLSNFECPGGTSSNTDPKLIIMTNSWGTSPGVILANGYKKKCGEDVDLL